MFRRRAAVYLALAGLAAGAAGVHAQSENLRVGFISAAPPDHPFWGQVVQVMQAAADDLDINLVVKYDPSRSTYATKRLGNKLIDSDPALDYLLTKYWVGVTDNHIERAQDRGTKVFVFNSDVPEADYEAVGSMPRAKYDNWIGHMVPDDRAAGYDLADILIKRVRKGGRTGKIRVLGLDGPFESTVGTNRIAGLKERVEASPEVDLQEVVATNWEAGAAGEKAAQLLTRYPDTDIVWAPNESITWGALQAVERSDKTPGEDIVVGGFDWNSESVKAIADGRITASMFGHFMEGAWALILVHDYHHGHDFADDTGVRIPTPLNMMTADNYPQYNALLREDGWESVDFRRFSKHHNPDLNSYNFNISQFLE
jgi:ABC-type sugar transport system substrate-binding protein